eukprot:909656-Rhodomonas_salina.1
MQWSDCCCSHANRHRCDGEPGLSDPLVIDTLHPAPGHVLRLRTARLLRLQPACFLTRTRTDHPLMNDRVPKQSCVSTLLRVDWLPAQQRHTSAE